MKLTPDEVRQRVFDAMMKADGDRAGAAAALGVSLRTLYRLIDDPDTQAVMQKMGWDKKPGPVKGSVRGLDIVRMQILEHIRGLGGRKLDFGVLTQDVFGEDDRLGRTKIYSAMQKLRKDGALAFDDSTGVWAVP